VVAIKADELPAERSDVGKELVGQRFALGAKLSRARQYRYSASKPLSYCSKAACRPPRRPAKPGSGAQRPTAKSKRGIMPEPLSVRFGTDSAMTPFSATLPLVTRMFSLGLAGQQHCRIPGSDILIRGN
jgi:hypothetical protein